MQFGQLNRRRFITPLASAAGSSLTVIVKTTIAIVLAIGTGTSSLALGPDDLESTSCSNESLTFMAWRTFAGRADQARLKGIPNVTKEDFVTRDGRALRGYHLASPTGSAKGYVLVAQTRPLIVYGWQEIVGDSSNKIKSIERRINLAVKIVGASSLLIAALVK
jgi:hypothetical protein